MFGAEPFSKGDGSEGLEWECCEAVEREMQAGRADMHQTIRHF